MAKNVLTDLHFTWNAVDLSAWVRALSGFQYEAETVDDTTMGTTGIRSNLAGLKTLVWDLLLAADEAANGPSQTLFSAHGSTATAILRTTSGATATNNPNYSTTMRLVSFTPMEGEIGGLNTARARLVSTGVALTRATS